MHKKLVTLLCKMTKNLEVPPGFGPGIKVLQTFALQDIGVGRIVRTTTYSEEARLHYGIVNWFVEGTGIYFFRVENTFDNRNILGGISYDY